MRLGDYSVTWITGWSCVLNWLLKSIANFIVKKVEQRIIYILENEGKRAIENILDPFSMSGFHNNQNSLQNVKVKVLSSQLPEGRYSLSYRGITVDGMVEIPVKDVEIQTDYSAKSKHFCMNGKYNLIKNMF